MNAIGIIGLGRMGMSAANRFPDAGIRVVGCDIRQEAMEKLRSIGAEAVEDAGRVAQTVESVIIFVLNDQQAIDSMATQMECLKDAAPARALFAWQPSTATICSVRPKCVWKIRIRRN